MQIIDRILNFVKSIFQEDDSQEWEEFISKLSEIKS